MPYGAPSTLHKPSIGQERNPRFVANESIDLRQREHLELLESLRNPRERDFYQDHTYHDQWEQRDLDKGQAAQLKARYGFFRPGYQVQPWVWYPGDIVEVVNGPHTGQRGSIIAVIPYKNEIIVQNINVKDITIPQGEGRPEQVVQREHPIRCTDTKHVDPSTGELCDLKILKVRSKAAAGAENKTDDDDAAVEERRISLQSGTILPIPPRNESKGVETGDPLKDTPYQDALETSYEAEKEMAVLVERKLAALEEHFVASLKQSYEFHKSRQEENALAMRQFQKDALIEAVSRVTEEMNKNAEQLEDWWFEDLAPHVEVVEREAAAEEARRAAKRAERRKRWEQKNGQVAALEKEINDDDSSEPGEEEEVEEEDEEIVERSDDVAAELADGADAASSERGNLPAQK